jgi:hypothetical protein
MANREGYHEVASRWQHFPVGLEAAAGSLQRSGDVHEGGIIRPWIARLPAQGEEFRLPESVREQHFLASLPRDDWRVQYEVDGYAGWQLMREIERRRKYGLSLEGLEWPPSDDPYSPANNPKHPYYLPKETATQLPTAAVGQDISNRFKS